MASRKNVRRLFVQRGCCGLGNGPQAGRPPTAATIVTPNTLFVALLEVMIAVCIGASFLVRKEIGASLRVLLILAARRICARVQCYNVRSPLSSPSARNRNTLPLAVSVARQRCSFLRERPERRAQVTIVAQVDFFNKPAISPVKWRFQPKAVASSNVHLPTAHAISLPWKVGQASRCGGRVSALAPLTPQAAASNACNFAAAGAALCA